MTSGVAKHPYTRFRTQNVEWQAHLQGVPLASFRARAAAFAIDSAIIAAVLMVWPLLTKPVGVESNKFQLTLSLEFGDLVSVVLAVLYFGLATYFGKGATPGKRLLGIRVISLVHTHMTLWHSLERALGYAASFLEAGFGFIQYFIHPNRQTVHDRIAETIVIVSRKTPVKAPARA